MYIKVKVTAHARKETIEETSPTSYEIKVKEPAERNQANERVITLIALARGIPAKNIRIINGHHSPSKLLSIFEE